MKLESSPVQSVKCISCPSCCAAVPSAPVRVEATVLSDSRVLVSWLQPQEPNGPPEELRYQVEVNGDTCWPKAPVRVEQTGEAALSLELDSLHSGTAYTFKVFWQTLELVKMDSP